MAVAILQPCYDFSTHCLMYKKSNLFVYKFVVNCQILYQGYPIKLKLGMLDHKNNTFRNTIFKISPNVPLKFPKTKTLADGLIKRTSSMLDEIESKTVHKVKEGDQ